jgi:hypothetical protein
VVAVAATVAVAIVTDRRVSRPVVHMTSRGPDC